MPAGWMKLFAFNIQVTGEDLGLNHRRKGYLASRVLPMGFLNAVGIANYLLRTLQTRKSNVHMGLPLDREVRRDHT